MKKDKVANDEGLDVWDLVKEQFKHNLYVLHEHETGIITKADLRKIRRKLRNKPKK